MSRYWHFNTLYNRVDSVFIVDYELRGMILKKKKKNGLLFPLDWPYWYCLPNFWREGGGEDGRQMVIFCFWTNFTINFTLLDSTFMTVWPKKTPSPLFVNADKFYKATPASKSSRKKEREYLHNIIPSVARGLRTIHNGHYQCNK